MSALDSDPMRSFPRSLDCKLRNLLTQLSCASPCSCGHEQQQHSGEGGVCRAGLPHGGRRPEALWQGIGALACPGQQLHAILLHWRCLCPDSRACAG